MYYVKAGTDTYGRVKSVGRTPVVTKFAMLQFLPLYPLQSFYSYGRGKKKSQGIPLVFRMQSVSLFGVPLASLDRTSIIMAYLRGIFGTLAIVGCIVIVSLITYLNGGHLDSFAQYATIILLGCLLIGAIGGGLTYAIPLVSPREKAIRTYCGQIIGMCIDPALVQRDFARAVQNFVENLNVETSSDVDDSSTNSKHIEIAKQLVRVRLQIALGGDDIALERLTNELLDRVPDQHIRD